MYSRETFNSILPAAHYDTNHVDRGKQIKGCDAHDCWKYNKTINYGDKSVHLSIFSTLYAIIGHFATFEGWPLDPLNAECFLGEPQIQFWINEIAAKWFI